jgi:hypothetical protein
MSTLHSHVSLETTSKPLLYTKVMEAEELPQLIHYAMEWLKTYNKEMYPEYQQLEKILQESLGFESVSFNYPNPKDTSYLTRSEMEVHDIMPEVTEIIRSLQM